MITALRGMKDIFDNEAKIYKFVIDTCQKIAQNYGYELCETPKLEETPLFRRSVGESSDIVGKEMYEFSDKSGTSVCLRPEGTAGVVRAFIEHKFDRIGGVKRFFYYGSMFRYERPQKGRLREFHQFGVECFGQPSVYEDAMLIAMLHEVLNALGIKTTLKLNSLGDKESMSEYKANLIQFASSHEENLCDDCKRRLKLNPIRILDCKNNNCQDILKDAPTILESLNQDCKNDFETLKELLKKANIDYEIDTKLVRGLDYYTKTAFEFVSDEIGAKSAVAGGGRYDGLVETLGGKTTSAVGWAIGIERIMEILKNKELNEKRSGIYMCVLNDEYLPQMYCLAVDLRKNHKVLLSYEAKSPNKHLNLADKNNAEIFLCLGEDEFKNGEIWYKNLENKEEKRIKIDRLKDEL